MQAPLLSDKQHTQLQRHMPGPTAVDAPDVPYQCRATTQGVTQGATGSSTLWEATLPGTEHAGQHGQHTAWQSSNLNSTTRSCPLYLLQLLDVSVPPL